jgi:uncharacterized protein (TIGR03118 family)
MQRSIRCAVRRTISLAVGCGLMLMLSGAALAQSYIMKRLVSDESGKAKYTDSLLGNPWGLAYGPGAPFWVSDEATGWSTLYDGAGAPQSLQVVVPPASGSGAGSPTGIVYNASDEFAIDSWVSAFLFATLDGTIQGWSHFNPSSTLIAVTTAGASYTGLAITNHTSGNYLYAADAANNKVDVYDGSFSLVKSFTDTTLPAGFAPFGIQDIGGKVYVTYAATNGGPGGRVDVFSESGTLEKKLISGKPLNQAWGLAVAPSDFGPLSGTLLVTNNIGKGVINGFDLSTGKLVGTVSDAAGDPIYINGIWGIEFGGGTSANGAKNALYYTAGPNDEQGFFGVITVAK